LGGGNDPADTNHTLVALKQQDTINSDGKCNFVGGDKVECGAWRPPSMDGSRERTQVIDEESLKELYSDTSLQVSGPVIFKTDGGPGRLSRESISIEFRHEMAALGFHIMLLLPNGMACTAEMDQLFEKFKPACSKNALHIAAKKMQVRFEVRKVKG
jgi:hypothetical protein